MVEALPWGPFQGQFKFTDADLVRAWDESCTEAYFRYRQEPKILLPKFLWPQITAMVNNATGKMTDVERYDPFPWNRDLGYWKWVYDE